MNRTRFVSALAMAALAAILSPSILTAQITFQRTYGWQGSYFNSGQSVWQTTDGGYMITGVTGDLGLHNSVYLVKTDAYGDTIWTRAYGPPEAVGYSGQQSVDGGFIVVGCKGPPHGYWDVLALKTDSWGGTLWGPTSYGGGEGYSVQQTADSGYVITGATRDGDVYLIKIDASGDPTWTKTYGDTGEDGGNSVQQTTDGGYIIAGSARSFGAGNQDAYLIKTDAVGDTLWTRTYGDTSDDVGYSVQQTADSGYVIAGATHSFGTGNYDVYLIKTDAGGDTLWTRTFGGTGDDQGNSVWQTTDGGYIITGRTGSYGAGYDDVYLVKTDASGGVLWTETYGGAGYDRGYSVQQTGDGGYVIAGIANEEGAYLVKLIKTDPLGNVGVAEPNADAISAPSLSLTCEPNPFRTRTAISLQLTADSPAELAVFDASGRCVRTLTADRTPCAVWDGTDELGQPLPSGAYFVRWNAGGEHASTRVVLQR